MKIKSKKMQYEEGLDPKIDVVFKTLFGKKVNEILIEDMLSGFLNQKIKCKNVLREARVGQLRADGKYGSLDETITVFRENTTKEFSRMHKYYVVELNKMDKTKCSEGTYKWLAFLNQNKEVLKEMSKDKCIQKAEDELKILAGDWETSHAIFLA